jgi:hypothetical protein
LWLGRGKDIVAFPADKIGVCLARCPMMVAIDWGWQS